MTVASAVEKIAGLLRAPTGLKESLLESGAEIAAEVMETIDTRVQSMQPTVEILERCQGFRGPVFLVYCRRATTRGKERLGPPQAELEVGVDVLVTQDALDGLTEQLSSYAGAASDALQRAAGCLGDRMVLSERQEVVFDPIKKGGLFLYQSARIQCNVMAFLE
jgi:hypothetical protein